MKRGVGEVEVEIGCWMGDGGDKGRTNIIDKGRFVLLCIYDLDGKLGPVKLFFPLFFTLNWFLSVRKMWNTDSGLDISNQILLPLPLFFKKKKPPQKTRRPPLMSIPPSLSRIA